MDDIYIENLRGFEIEIKTRAGVFSKQGLDNGTKLLINLLKVGDGMVVADLGSGAGVLGIVLAKLNRSGHVHLLDDHLRSVELARENIELNKVRNAEVFLSDLFSAVGERSYHQIFSNPPAQMGNDFLEEVVNECYKHLKPKGSLWLVIPTHLKPVMERFLEKTFNNSTIVGHGKEHVVLLAQKGVSFLRKQESI